MTKTRPGNAVVTDQLIDQRREEADVVDTLAIGCRCPASIGPALIDAIGIRDDEAERVGDGVVVRDRLLRCATGPGSVQVDHQTGRVVIADRGMDDVGALNTIEGQRLPRTTTWNRRGGGPLSQKARGDDDHHGRHTRKDVHGRTVSAS